ncbi:DUF6531 domain-containing protein [Polyangium sp. 15x6]|uniref:DUF6531 domain-containing protein n=1 Tax=Polyangium sp. 15x6 TaxID=3042687 RepID=UPI00249C75A0|nr:DUF6531 domain-containing protein [Polyangium sp. 15x6]MDI3291326.1 DUF6531 domain-containing protein [Polyangium sp. 15x6]
MASIGGMKIATTGSGHFCPGPTPAMSLVPPTPPAGPVTAPFAYISHSSTAQKVSNHLLVAYRPVLTQGSVMSIHAPGNLPGQPTGGDIVTHMTSAYSEVAFAEQHTVLAGGRPVACTNDMVRMNVPYQGTFIAQAIGRLFTMDNVLWARSAATFAACSQVILDPVSVVSGAVVDTDIDVSLPGPIAITWTRAYDSTRASEHGPLGHGGWTHAYDQWIEVKGEELQFRDEDGSTLVLRNVSPGKTVVHRRKRIEVRLDARGGGASVVSLATGIRRVFRPQGGARARLVEITNPSGQRIQLDYESDKLVRLVDTAGRIVRLTHDERGHLTRIAVFAPGDERAPLQTVSFGYDTGGELVRVTDPLGNDVTYSYDERRRLVKKTLPTGLSFHYVYDPDTGRCVRAFGDGGIHAGDITYDEQQGTTRLSGTLSPRVFSWRPKDGALLGVTTNDGSAARTWEIDDDGLIVTEKDAAGNTSRFEYDARGNLVNISDPLGRVTELVHVDDRVVRRVAGGRVTEYAYDARGQLTSVKYPGGVWLTLDYDEHGRLVRIADAAGIRARFVWDDRHQCIEEHLAGGLVRKWKYDGLGRPIACVDSYGNTTRRELDALGRVLVHENPDGTRVQFEYDALGRKTRRTDELGRVATFRYAGLGSAVEVRNEDGKAWAMSHDLLERPQRIQNPKAELHDFRYDRLGRVTEMRTFDGRIVRAAYGRNGLVSRLSMPDGTWRAYRYNELDELIEEDTPHGAGRVVRDEGARKVAYELEDPAGRVSVEMHWDEGSRIVSATQSAGTIRYEYDALNRRTAVHLPSGKVTRYVYDEAGRVAAIEHGGERVEFARDGAGAMIGFRFARSGVEARFAFDVRGRITQEWASKDGRALVSRGYTWDASSALTGKRDARWGEVRYRHDEVGQLVEAGEERFEYDAAGSVEPAGDGWDVGPGNVLRRTSDAAYTYDEANRRIRKKRLDTGETTEYFWDCRGNLREVVRGDGTRILMTYDLFGRRVKKEVVGPIRPVSREELPPLPSRRTVEYLWDGDLLLAEIDAERGERTLVYHPDTMVPLLQGEGDVVYGVLADHVGAATELVDGAGGLAFSGSHSAWGALARSEAKPGPSGRPVAPLLRRLGHHHDEDVGLSYVRYRWFDPEVMRFLSPDPLGLEGGANLFAWNGSPVMHVDPLGLACVLLGNPRVDRFISECMTGGRRDNGSYQVYVHGTVDAVHVQHADGSWTQMSPRDLGLRLIMAGNWDRNVPLHLFSCNTGRRPDAVAAQLASQYRVNVYAPSELVWGPGLHIAPPIGVQDSSRLVPQPGVDYYPDTSRPGKWNSWAAGGYPKLDNHYPDFSPRSPPP